MANDVTIVVWAKDGCSYCEDVKQYLTTNGYEYKIVDVTNNDSYRDILETKYSVRYVPVVEIGQGLTYEAVTAIGVEHLDAALAKYKEVESV